MVNRYNPRRRLRRRLHEKKRAKDLISSLPDEILQHILSFSPTKFAIRTSLLSKRWRYIWCDTPSLSFSNCRQRPASIDKTQMCYKAPKMKYFRLKNNLKNNNYYIKKWITFAMSRNVENLSLEVYGTGFKIPASFFINSSIKQLNIELAYISSQCLVSWPSLKKLSLRCKDIKVLDLSKLLHLRTLEINSHIKFLGPTQIVAPHIHCLRLIASQLPCTLVDISSLTEAKLDICIKSRDEIFKADFPQLQAMVLEMLEKLQNVEKLTFGGNFLQILSLAGVRGVPFPMLKVKTLILETVIFQYVIPGIERLLQNSFELKKLMVRARDCNTIPGSYLTNYLDSLGLDPNICWRSKDGKVILNKSHRNIETKHVTSFIEFTLKNTKSLDKMVVQLDERYISFRFKDLVPTLIPNNNVSIGLSTKPMILGEW
ncbi:hypothetical protein ARALYDRAFT_337885 [Arabidopsis lyrata subsp. lyrata]|uniref:F-box domain-containing protein n=1 Tax=Arabidopsis lyrata subsp. lyrata TaxID=81972 RepID=D7KC74_ARALL|nr:hypothetical protein ARALYDRAFT_337885 [Arabidopsis lyrata subsp. lyrata]